MAIKLNLNTIVTTLELNSIEMKKQSLKDCLAELKLHKNNENLSEVLDVVNEALVTIGKRYKESLVFNKLTNKYETQNKEQQESKKLEILATLDIENRCKIIVHELITGTKKEKADLMLDKASITRLIVTKLSKEEYSLDYVTSKTTLTTEIYSTVPKNLARYTTSQEPKEGFIKIKGTIEVGAETFGKLEEKLQVQLMKCLVEFKELRQEFQNAKLSDLQGKLKDKITESLETVKNSVKSLEQQVSVYEVIVGGENNGN